MMENAFHFTLKALFVLMVFNFFLSCHVEKRLAKINVKIYDVINWETDHCNNCPIPQEVRQSDNKNWLVNRIQEEKQVETLI